jgi:hypothetical protein
MGFPLNFSVDEDFFNINTGPMEKAQSKEQFMDDDELPSAGVYVDVDYFRKEFSPHVSQRNIFDLLDKSISKAENIKKLIADWTTE